MIFLAWAARTHGCLAVTMVFALHIPHSLYRSIRIHCQVIQFIYMIVCTRWLGCYVKAKHITYTLCWPLVDAHVHYFTCYLNYNKHKYKQKKATYFGFIASSFCPKYKSKVHILTNTCTHTHQTIICLKKWPTWVIDYGLELYICIQLAWNQKA